MCVYIRAKNLLIGVNKNKSFKPKKGGKKKQQQIVRKTKVVVKSSFSKQQILYTQVHLLDPATNNNYIYLAYMATNINLIEEYRRAESYIAIWLNWNNWFGLTSIYIYICKLDVCIYGTLIEELIWNLNWINWFGLTYALYYEFIYILCTYVCHIIIYDDHKFELEQLHIIY